MSKGWRKEIRKACETITSDPEKYWKAENTVSVGNIRIRANVFAGKPDLMFGAVYIIPIFRLMYKSDHGWFGNFSNVESVIAAIEEKLDFKVYEK